MQFEVVQGDITDQQVDAIVNAANSSLLGGGGVDGAIHRRGGPQLLAECRQLRETTHRTGLPVGSAVATTAGELPARWVIHTVGPIHGRGDAEQLRSCYTESLRVATALGAGSIAFPLISAGAYGWPLDDAISQAVTVLGSAPNPGVARLVLWQRDAVRAAERIVADLGPRRSRSSD
ncbi:MAG: O-acetyl-ADP-ribose deacetylase [Pseudonocardiales bacterium]|jgi:O-acetyl-ADP-ribose deacetylase (regulator of RNase III)|nr:O-acetyl-ADP-ribose deacetylase [Pseudonocardiales bacterium]